MKSILIFLTAVAMTMTQESALQEFTHGNYKFTAHVYKELSKNHKGNFVISPFSAETILALTQAGAKGPTSEELTAGLSLPSSPEKTQTALKQVLPTLKKSDDSLKLLSANKLYISQGYKVKEDFLKVSKEVYESDIENVNFSKKAETSGLINSWVEEHTNSKIKNLVSPDSLDEMTRLVLVNAVYFKGRWVHPFDSYTTRKQPFFKNKQESIEVEMMHVDEDFNYYESKELGAKFLELPYMGDTNISMVIVLPNEIDGLAGLEENLESVLQAPDWIFEKVDVSVPKFSVETKTDFVPILKSLGIQKALDSRLANFTGISNEDGLYVSEVIQKAFINVTEAGTEASAATEGELHNLSGPSARVKADHPFVYYVQCQGIILFAGKFIDPE